MSVDVAGMRANRHSAQYVKILVSQKLNHEEKLPILILEGHDDLGCYGKWILNFGVDINKYEIICARKKKYALSFFYHNLDNDEIDFSRIFMILDSDYDGFKDYNPHENILLTDRHSLENYLIDDINLKFILKTSFHCDNLTSIRISEIFKQDLKTFVNLIKDDVRKIFVAAKEKISININDDYLSRKINIEFNNIFLKNDDICLVKINVDDIDLIENSYFNDDFERNSHNVNIFRGKFLYSFYMAWLKSLEKAISEQGDDFKEQNIEKSSIDFHVQELSFWCVSNNYPLNLKEFILDRMLNLSTCQLALS